MNSKNSDEPKDEPKDETLSDEELQSVLREIEIPNDLKLRLAQIAMGDASSSPDEVAAGTANESQANVRTKSVGRRVWVGVVLAASVLLAAMFGFYSIEGWFSREDGLKVAIEDESKDESIKVADPVVPQTVNSRETKDAPPSDSDSAGVLEKLAQLDRGLSEEILVLEYQAKIEVLERRLRSTERISTTTQDNLASRREAASVILAMSGKAMGRYESANDRAVEEMRFVIENYPESRGAEIATEFINEVTRSDQH